jgi:hypothetical protein
VRINKRKKIVEVFFIERDTAFLQLQIDHQERKGQRANPSKTSTLYPIHQVSKPNPDSLIDAYKCK